MKTSNAPESLPAQKERTPYPESTTPFKTAYSAKRRDVTIQCSEISPYTDQSFKAESDINTIMARYQSTGVLPILNEANAQWLDVSETSFQEHMDAIIEAKNLFQQLPSKVREKFANDPGQFLSFCEDQSNLPELARMGLLTVEATQRVLNPPPSPNLSTNEDTEA